MTLAKTAVAVIALTWLLTTPVLAFQTGGVQVKGNVNQSVTADTMLNMAIGADAKAGQSVATIHNGAEIGGNVSQSVHAKHLINLSIGKGTVACQQIGTIGNNPACR